MGDIVQSEADLTRLDLKLSGWALIERTGIRDAAEVVRLLMPYRKISSMLPIRRIVKIISLDHVKCLEA